MITGDVPQDWKSANVTAISRKVISEVISDNFAKLFMITGDVSQDWKSANVTAISKKVHPTTEPVTVNNKSLN